MVILSRLVPLHHQLMSPCYKLYIVIMIELIDDIAAEEEARSSR